MKELIKNIFIFQTTKNPLLYGRIFGVFLYLEIMFVVIFFPYQIAKNLDDTGTVLPIKNQVSIEFNESMTLLDVEKQELPAKISKSYGWMVVDNPSLAEQIGFHSLWFIIFFVIIYETYHAKMLSYDIANNGIIHGRVVKRLAFIEGGIQLVIFYILGWNLISMFVPDVSFRNEFVEITEHREFSVLVFLVCVFLSYLLRMIGTYIKNSLVGNK
jgi:hypothetical protein